MNATRVAKVGISLPRDLLTTVDRERRARRQTRSEFFRRAVEEFLRREREREDDERYARAYLEQPETDEDMAWVVAAGAAAFADNPWEE